MDHAGLLMGSVGTENGRVSQSLDLVRAEWIKMRDDGPTPQELEDAKNYIDGSYPLNLTSTSRIARTLVQLQYDNLGIDYMDRRKGLIAAVTIEDVRRVARRAAVARDHAVMRLLGLSDSGETQLDGHAVVTPDWGARDQPQAGKRG